MVGLLTNPKCRCGTPPGYSETTRCRTSGTNPEAASRPSARCSSRLRITASSGSLDKMNVTTQSEQASVSRTAQSEQLIRIVSMPTSKRAPLTVSG